MANQRLHVLNNAGPCFRPKYSTTVYVDVEVDSSGTLIFKSDDGTPVTMFSLTQAGALTLPSLTLTTALAETDGGTGFDTYTLGDLLYSDASNSLAKLAGNTTTAKQFLSQTGTGSVSAAPAWAALAAGDIASGTFADARIAESNVTQHEAALSIAVGQITGTLLETQGGTGLATYTLGQMLYSDAANSLAALAGNTSATKNFLTQTGDGTNSAAPAWGTIAAADLPTHTHAAGDITSGTLAVARGGLNLSTVSLGGLPYGSAADVYSILAGNTTTTKQFLTQTGDGVNSAAPAWGTIAAADYPTMVGADGTNAGTKGAVPAPAATDNVNFLRGDGTWAAASGSDNSSTGDVTLNADSDGNAAGAILMQIAGVTKASVVNGGHFAVTATGRIYLDGIAGTGDTYIFEEAANKIGFATAGTVRVQVGTTGGATTLFIPDIVTSASAANVFIDTGDGYALKRSTSSLRYKNVLREFSLAEARAVIFGADPMVYTSKAEADDPTREYVGLTAERFADVDPRFVHFGENGRPDGLMYERLAVPFAVMLRDIDHRLAALEAQRN